MAQKTYKYAYSILYYEGDKDRERGECKGFVEELYSRFSNRTGNKYRAYWQWQEETGQDKYKVLSKVRELSKITIALFSPTFEKDDWHAYSNKQALLAHLSTERLFPISILGADVPERYIAITSLKFHPDWRDDSGKWRILLNAICKDLDDVEKYSDSDKSLPMTLQYGGPPVDTDDEEDEELEFPDDDQLEKLAQNIGMEKSQIGSRLGLKHSEMEQIENDHLRNTHNQIHTMLKIWRQRSGKKTAQEKFEKLELALKKGGRRDLAEKLQKYYKKYTQRKEEKEGKKHAKEVSKLEAQIKPTELRQLKVEEEIEAAQIKIAEVESARENEAMEHFTKMRIQAENTNMQQESASQLPTTHGEDTSYTSTASEMVTGKETSHANRKGTSIFENRNDFAYISGVSQEKTCKGGDMGSNTQTGAGYERGQSKTVSTEAKSKDKGISLFNERKSVESNEWEGADEIGTNMPFSTTISNEPSLQPKGIQESQHSMNNSNNFDITNNANQTSVARSSSSLVHRNENDFADESPRKLENVVYHPIKEPPENNSSCEEGPGEVSLQLSENDREGPSGDEDNESTTRTAGVNTSSIVSDNLSCPSARPGVSDQLDIDIGPRHSPVGAEDDTHVKQVEQKTGIQEESKPSFFQGMKEYFFG